MRSNAPRTSAGSVANHSPCTTAHGRAPAAQPGEVRPRELRAPPLTRRSPRSRRGPTAARARATTESRQNRCRGRRSAAPRPESIRARARRGRVLHHLLGLGPRDEHPAVDRQVEPRNDHDPSTYCNGSPAARRVTISSKCAAATFGGVASRSPPDACSAIHWASRRDSNRGVADTIRSSHDGCSASGACQLLRALVRHQRVDDLVELTGEHAVELVERQSDAMVGDAVLLEVVGADLLGASATSDLAASSVAELGGLLVLLELEQPRPSAPAAHAVGSGSGFSSCIDTTRPVGLCVTRTAESVVFTD